MNSIVQELKIGTDVWDCTKLRSSSTAKESKWEETSLSATFDSWTED